jgi:SOS-response transcriptional repressor LexA
MNMQPAPTFHGCRPVATESLAIRCGARTFALRMADESMRGRCILPEDIVVLEHGIAPRPGDVVAALVDNESVVRTYVVQRGRPLLAAAHPGLATLLPAEELVIQGVMVCLIRHRKG